MAEILKPSTRDFKRVRRGASRVLLFAGVFALMWVAFRTDAGPTSSAHIPDEEPYPPGPWWRDAEAINRVVFSAAHILISHAGARFDSGPYWVPAHPNLRTAQAAMARCSELSALARRSPDQFASLAARFSDDAATAPFGGALGVARGNTLPPELIDALGRLKPSEVSLPVRSDLGCHVVRSLELPEKQQLSARHVLIAHRDVPAASEIAVRRSRDEALALARDLHHQLSEHPERFDGMAAELSDAADAERNGDLGTWSTYEAGASSLLLHAISLAKVGEIAPLVEDHAGFHIALRTEPLPRPQYEAAFIAVAHGQAQHAAIDQPVRSAEEALQLAAAVAQKWRTHPDDYAALRAQHCDAWLCALSELQWQNGRVPPPFSLSDPIGPIVRELAEGQVALQPVAIPNAAVVVMRRAPKNAAHEQVLLSLPRPRLELEDAFATASNTELAVYLQAFELVAKAKLELSDSESERVGFVFASLRERLGPLTPQLRLEAVRDADRQLATLLGEQRHAQLTRLKNTWFERMFNR